MRVRSEIAVAITLLAIAGFTGCVHVRNGIHNMIADATDIIRLDVSGSFGTDMGAHVMLTEFAQLKSYSYEDLYRVGFGSRHIGVWKEARQDWWVCTRHGQDIQLSRESVKEKVGCYAPGRMRAGTEPPFRLFGEWRDEVGLGAHFLVVGARVGVRPFELLDLFTNLVGFDLSKDNSTWEERKAWHAARRAAKEAAAKSEAGAETDTEPKPIAPD